MIGMFLSVVAPGGGRRGQCKVRTELRLARHGSLLELGNYLHGLRPRLLRLLAGKYPDRRHEAEDIVQDTIVSLLAHEGRSFRRFRRRCALDTYVQRATLKRAYSHLRSSQRQPEELDPETAARFPAADAPEREALQGYTSEQLRATLAKLPEQQRRAVSLFYLGLQTYQEIADLLGVSRGNAANLVRKGLDSFRRHLNPSLLPEGLDRLPDNPRRRREGRVKPDTQATEESEPEESDPEAAPDAPV